MDTETNQDGVRSTTKIANERQRILRSHNQFWKPHDLSTPQSVTLRLLSQLTQQGELRRIKRGLYWRGTKTPLGMPPPPTAELINELVPGPGVGPAGLYAANVLKLSTQVPRRCEIAVPHRAPRNKSSIIFRSRTARKGRITASLNSTEVAVLEVLSSWESTVELPAKDAVTQLFVVLSSPYVRKDKLVVASKTEPVKVRVRLQELLRRLDYEDLANLIHTPNSSVVNNFVKNFGLREDCLVEF